MKKTTLPLHNNTRQHLLEIGYQLITGKGFSALGLSELLREAKVSKGAFYHHFSSKEAFGVALIEEYFTHNLASLDALLENDEYCGKDRIFSYLQELQRTQSVETCERPCLVVKLSAEVSGLSEPMRLALQHGCDAIVSRLTASLAAGQEDGSLPKDIAPERLAKTLYYLWLGACLANALVQDDSPLEIAMEQSRMLLCFT